MGLVEVVLEYITVKSIIVFAVVAWWLWVAVKRFDESIRLRRLAPGTRGQSLNAHLPGGRYSFLLRPFGMFSNEIQG